ncbi:MAG: TetR/AcrR family transcriptional regulator [Breznakibacter sp.]
MTQEQMEIVTRVGELYLRYGIKSVTMDDVARELGVSKKTLYQYFSDKGQLVEAVIQMKLAQSTEMAKDIMDKGVDAVEEMYLIHKFLDLIARQHSHVAEYDLKKYYPALFNSVLKFKRERLYDTWKTNIEKGKTEGLYRPEANTEIISKTNLLRFESSIESCIFTTEELLSQDFFTEMFTYHIRGIATCKGIERMEEILKQKP